MTLNNDISPLVAIIFKVFADIKHFLMVLIIVVVGFALSFELIARNQIEFDSIEEDDYPGYDGFIPGLKYVYLTSLGENDNESFEVGENPKNIMILWILYALLTFMVCIHLLNMLIAIMGETFGENKESEKPNRIRDHLRFVIFNWALDPLEDQILDGSVNYLVSAIKKES